MKKRIKKGMMVIGVVFCIGLCANHAKAATKSSLLAKIKSQTDEKIAKQYYADFDGNGNKELFAITGVGEGAVNGIWYASAKQIKCFDVLGEVYYSSVCKVSIKQRLFIMECGAGGSSSYSKCFYVKSGIVHEVKNVGEGLTHISGKNFKIHPGAFDANYTDGTWTGHTYKAYYLKWNGKKFVEYKAKKISISKLKKYSGSASILSQIKKIGCKVKSVYYRSNDLIHINVVWSVGTENHYENVTLKVKGNRVSVVVCNKVGKNIIQKSSYGGIYQAKAY